MTTSTLKIRDLNVWYGQRQALKDISLDIPDRQITAIIGPSGCGKTTLLKCMNRLLEIHDGVRVEGQVLVGGEDIYAPGVDLIRLRRKMGLLAQRPQVLPMSIYDNVAFGPRLHGERGRPALDRIVESRLRMASLWDEVHDRLHGSAAHLSIGQQQRLCLARGLAVDPDIILGDEPTSALDPMSSRNVEDCLKTLRTDYTIILVTHILRQARRLADHVVFLYLGEVIEAGPIHEVFENPRTDLMRQYLQGAIS
jgi:phosphate transport system ATP-binding protein